MTHPSPARRLLPVFLSLFAAATLLLALGAADSTAAPKPSGKAVFKLGSGKSGKALKKQRVKIKAIAPAKLKRLSAGRVKVAMTPASIGKTVRLKGGLRFVRGKRTLKAKGLVIAGKAKSIRITGKLGGRKLTLFSGKGKRNDRTAHGIRTVKVNGKLKLTRPAAKLIRKKLKLRRKLPAAAIGGVNTDLRVQVDPDPYFGECGLPTKATMLGNLPPAAPLPNMTGAKPLAESTPAIKWGFMTRFREYVSQWGKLSVLNGAGRDGSDADAGFTFPVSGGSYKENGPGLGDDQAVINGKGTAIFCNPPHKFRVALSNPTIVIDGADSRVVADIDLNYFGVWIPKQRVDLGEIDLGDATPFFNRSGAEVTWPELSATLSAVGAQSLCVPENDMGFPAQCLYDEGEPLDPVKPVVHLAGPQPVPAAITEFCDWTPSAATDNGRIAPNWPATPARPLAAEPGVEPVSSAKLDWGVRQGMRGSGPNSFNEIVVKSLDVARSDPANMSGPGKFFTWSGTGGSYDPGDAGPEDDRLVQPFKGTVGLCSEAHGYGSVIADPTVVIDGPNSRLSADVSVRVGNDGDWIRGRVDLVEFDAADATRTSESGDPGQVDIVWTVPDGIKDTSGVLLGENGAKMLEPIGRGAPVPPYAPGAAFQGMTIRTSIPES